MHAALTWRFLLALLLLTAATASPAAAEPEGTGDATVLIYHHFGDNRYPTTNVAMAAFAEQMAYLADNGYTVIPLSDLVTRLRKRLPLAPKSVVITIDDGYRTVYSHAWPLLRKYGFPFTVFLYVQGVERGYSNYMTWEQVREMARAGVDFEDHSFSHYRLADWPPDWDEPRYRSWIRRDLTRGAAVLAARLGRPPRFFAIPYGEYNRLVIEEARKVGYQAILTQDPGSVSLDTDRFLIPREPILGREWATMPHFRKVLERVDLPLADLVPDLEPLTVDTPPRFGGRLLHPDRYLPGSLGIYVSELGWRRASRSGDRVWVENDHPLQRRLNRVMVSGREKGSGRIALRSWLLVRRPH